MKRVRVALIIVLMVVNLAGVLAVGSVAAQDPPPTPTPTPTLTPTPDHTDIITLDSGQPARIVYQVDAGQYMIGILLFASVVIQGLLLVQVNRLQK